LVPRGRINRGALYGVGVFLASYSYLGLGWLYMTFGVVGGIGLGLSYIVPISVLVNGFRTIAD